MEINPNRNLDEISTCLQFQTDKHVWLSLILLSGSMGW